MSDLPDRGALVWVDFTPQSGREQSGHRPALVMSPRIYHERSKLAVVCPITSNTRPWPWKGGAAGWAGHIRRGPGDQVRAIDRAARRLRPAGAAPQTVVAEVQGQARRAARDRALAAHAAIRRPRRSVRLDADLAQQLDEPGVGM